MSGHMDLAPDDEQSAVAELARTLAIEVLAPAAREAERSGAVPQSVWATVFESGLAIAVPESAGGGGVPGDLSRQVAVQNLASGDAGIAMAAVWSGAAAGLIAEHGSEEQRKQLPSLASDASLRTSVALYEGFGRSPREMATTVRLEGDLVRVSGTKVGVPFARVADPLIVVGRDPRSGKLRAAVTSSAAKGVTVAPTRRGLALDAAQLGSVSFDAVLPANALLGGPSLDGAALTASLQRLRLLVASALLGTALRATEYAAKYAADRVAFGRPIGSFQGVSFPLAESLIRIEASRLQVADLVTSQGRLGEESFDQAVSEAIAYASTVAVDATRHAVQTLGGHGFMEDHPVELWYRSASALAALDFDPVCAPFEPAL